MIPLALFLAQVVSPFAFRVDRLSEVVVELEMSSPGSDWSKPGREAAVARLEIANREPHHVILFAGPDRHRYRLLLGTFAAGAYSLTVTPDKQYSAPASGFAVHDARFRMYTADDPDYPVMARAPMLYARPDTIGRFSDIPLLMYCERAADGTLTYTVVFSNEDGGTTTRGLMARWGRTTDIEYILRLNPSGSAIVQGRDHKDLPFEGRRDAGHPLLTPVTLNNMVEGNTPTALRFQPAPILVDLSRHSREHVMDEDPVTYEVMRKELEREKKLRPFGTVNGELISDPKNYLYVEYRQENATGATAVRVRRRNESTWYSSNLGRVDYGIDRSGWVRTTVELPPGTRKEQIEEIGFDCMVALEKGRAGHSGVCNVKEIGRVFLLDQPPLRIPFQELTLPSGTMAAIPLR